MDVIKQLFDNKWYFVILNIIWLLINPLALMWFIICAVYNETDDRPPSIWD